MENISKIHLAFENCEGLDLPIEDVTFFIASEITESIRIENILKNTVTDRVTRYKTAKFVRFTFRNKPEYKRIFQYNDIAQIHLYDADGNHEWFYVDYDEVCSLGDNKNQQIRDSYLKGEYDVIIYKEQFE